MHIIIIIIRNTNNALQHQSFALLILYDTVIKSIITFNNCETHDNERQGWETCVCWSYLTGFRLGSGVVECDGGGGGGWLVGDGGGCGGSDVSAPPFYFLHNGSSSSNSSSVETRSPPSLQPEYGNSLDGEGGEKIHLTRLLATSHAHYRSINVVTIHVSQWAFVFWYLFQLKCWGAMKLKPVDLYPDFCINPTLQHGVKRIKKLSI